MKELILIGINMEEVNRALSKLEPKQQNKALKKALKATALQARERLGEKAQSSYTIKNAGFKKAMRIQQISGAAPAATIHSEGEPLPLYRFKISKARKTTRAQVLKNGRLKELKRGNIKAFVNNIAGKDQKRKCNTAKGKKGSQVRHFAVAQRAGKKRLGINEKFSNSIPVMIGSQKHVYGLVEPHITADLHENLQKFINEALGG